MRIYNLLQRIDKIENPKDAINVATYAMAHFCQLINASDTQFESRFKREYALGLLYEIKGSVEEKGGEG